MRLSQFICGLVTLTLATGCAGTSWLKWNGAEMPSASDRNPVVQVIGLWQPGEGTGTDEKPTRGFVGQLFFIGGQTKTPVRVKGDVRIYLFDDVGTPDEQSKPLHQFDFPAEAWDMHLTKTKMGPAYAVFVPYTRKGHHQATCAIRVRLTMPNQSPVFSDMASVALGGSAKKALPLAPPNLGGGAVPTEPAADSPTGTRPNGDGLTSARGPARSPNTTHNGSHDGRRMITTSVPSPTPADTPRAMSLAERERILAEVTTRMRHESDEATGSATRHTTVAHTTTDETEVLPVAGNLSLARRVPADADALDLTHDTAAAPTRRAIPTNEGVPDVPNDSDRDAAHPLFGHRTPRTDTRVERVSATTAADSTDSEAPRTVIRADLTTPAEGTPTTPASLSANRTSAPSTATSAPAANPTAPANPTATGPTANGLTAAASTAPVSTPTTADPDPIPGKLAPYKRTRRPAQP